MSAAGSSPAPTEVLYRERLLPSPAVWLVGAVFGLVLGVILVPISVTLAVVVSLVMAVTMCIVLGVTSPVLLVSPGEVQCGQARIEPELLGPATVLDREAWDQTMGVGFEPLAHHVTRGWIRGGVRMPVLDAEDPTTAWVVSSRRPEAFALALQAAREDAAAPRSVPQS